jgi:hypothetical protein
VHLLGGRFGVVLVAIGVGCDGVELVAAHHHDEERLRHGIARDREDVAVAARVVVAVGLLLVRLARVEAPEAAVRLQELGRVLALGAPCPVRRAVGVRRRAHLDVQHAGLVERERLRVVLVLVGQPGDDDLGLALRHERAGRHLVAEDRRGRRRVEPAVAQRDACTAARAERRAGLGAAVAVGVAQRDDANGLHLDVDVAVRRDRHEAERPEIVGHHDGAEAGRQLDPAVVLVRGWKGRAGGRGESNRERGDQSSHSGHLE